MSIIKFKSRSLIRRFGTKPVRVPRELAKQYIDRGHAIPVAKKAIKVKDIEEIKEIKEIEQTEEFTVEEEETPEKVEEALEEVEEKFEVKIKKPDK